jgi:hypothetical protein
VDRRRRGPSKAWTVEGVDREREVVEEDVDWGLNACRVRSFRTLDRSFTSPTSIPPNDPRDLTHSSHQERLTGTARKAPSRTSRISKPDDVPVRQQRLSFYLPLVTV